jgi:hypothetical protein
MGFLFEYFVEVYPNQQTEEELQIICKQCWHKWTIKIQENEPGLNDVWRKEDSSMDGDN